MGARYVVSLATTPTIPLPVWISLGDMRTRRRVMQNAQYATHASARAMDAARCLSAHARNAENASAARWGVDNPADSRPVTGRDLALIAAAKPRCALISQHRCLADCPLRKRLLDGAIDMTRTPPPDHDHDAARSVNPGATRTRHSTRHVATGTETAAPRHTTLRQPTTGIRRRVNPGASCPDPVMPLCRGRIRIQSAASSPGVRTTGRSGRGRCRRRARHCRGPSAHRSH